MNICRGRFATGALLSSIRPMARYISKMAAASRLWFPPVPEPVNSYMFQSTVQSVRSSRARPGRLKPALSPPFMPEVSFSLNLLQWGIAGIFMRLSSRRRQSNSPAENSECRNSASIFSRGGRIRNTFQNKILRFQPGCSTILTNSMRVTGSRSRKSSRPGMQIRRRHCMKRCGRNFRHTSMRRSRSRRTAPIIHVRFRRSIGRTEFVLYRTKQIFRFIPFYPVRLILLHI